MLRTLLLATPLLVLLALTALTTLAAPGVARSADDPIDPFGFHESDYSSWGIVDAPYPYDPAVAPPQGCGRPNAQGCFPVGNGLVFATLGLDGDFNTLTNITGPGYQTRDENGQPVYWQAGDWPEQQLLAYKQEMKPGVDETGQSTNIIYFSHLIWQTQSIQCLRGAAAIRTRLKCNEGILYGFTYAVPGQSGIVREFAFVPEQRLEAGTTIGLSVPASAGEVSNPLCRIWERADSRMYLDFYYATLGNSQAQHYAMLLDTSGIFRTSMVYEMVQRDRPIWMIESRARSDEKTESSDVQMLGPFMGASPERINEYRNSMLSYWREWSSHNLKFDTGDPRLDDLLTQLPVSIETQRDAASGGVAPLVSYHGYWVRDSLGPLYMYLLNGRFEEVERMLRYHRQACWKLGASSMLVPLDVDVSEVKEPVGIPVGARLFSPSPQQGDNNVAPTSTLQGDNNVAPTSAGDLSVAPTDDTGETPAPPTPAPPTTWDAVPVEHAEVPSLIVLQHYWLWQALRAAGRADEADAFIAEAWPFITHNLFAMQFDPQYGVRFHGDETYTNGALYSTFDSGLPDMLGWPNGYIPTDFFSFDNTLLHCGAAKAASELAQALGDSALHQQAEELGASLDSVLSSYYNPIRGIYAPAISPLTGQQFSASFSNISLCPWALGVPYDGLWLHYQYWNASLYLQWDDTGTESEMKLMPGNRTEERDQDTTSLQSWTTPWSGFGTGHSLGTWLNASRFYRMADSKRICDELIRAATPEGAWCEIYDPQGNPVNVYSRVNRIRPWESGINYAMLAAWLNQQGQMNVASGDSSAQVVLSKLTDRSPGCQPDMTVSDGYIKWTPEWFGNYLAPDDSMWTELPTCTQLLVLTRDNHYKDVIKQDRRLSALKPEQVCAWDIGLPIMPEDLRQALFVGAAEMRPSDPAAEGSGAGAGAKDNSGGGGTPPSGTAAEDGRRAAAPTQNQEGGLSVAHAKDTGETPAPPEDGGTAAASTRLRIPYLYLDRDVKLSDRRTFKTQAFWDAVQPVLDEYTQLGGQVIDENTLSIALADDEVVALKMLLVLYPRTFTWEMDADTIANFHQEIARWIGWCDKVGGDKFRIDIDFLQIDRRLAPLSCGPQGGNVYWMGFSDVEADLLARGIPRDYYDSVCCFWAWDREAPSLPGGEAAAQAYGGAAQGPGSDVALLGAPGRTSYYGAAVLKSHFVTTGRVALHEYLHNLDAMFEMAGMQDQFYSSDDMEAHMPELLKEQPGAFAAVGYDDAAMLELAGQSERGEAGFPWRTQLVYYEWQIERTGRADFAQLLRRYGAREKRAPRERLYRSFIMPEGAEAYQIEFPVGQASSLPEVGARLFSPSPQQGDNNVAPTGDTGDLPVAPTGLAPITIEDVDPDDGYVHWRSAALGGFLADGDVGVPLRRYREAEIVAPDFSKIVLGQDEPKLSASLRETGSGEAIADAQAVAVIAGQTYALFSDDAGSYNLPLPGGLETETRVTLKAKAADYIISDNPVTITIRPAWTSTVQFRSNRQGGPPISSPFDPGIHVSIDGPPGEYKAQLSYQPDYNTVLQKLADDGLLPRAAELDTTFTLAAGAESYIECDRYDWEALQYKPGTLRVVYTAADGKQSSFSEKLPLRLPRTTLLAGIDATKLPGYIPRAIMMSPTIDGDLADWPTAPRVDGELGKIPAWPSLNLTTTDGHAFNGTFTGDADCAAQIWFAYDTQNLYVAGRVTDDFIKRGDMWSSDRLNLVFDARCDTTRATYPHGAVGHTGWEADDWWVLLCPFMSSGDGQPLTERLGGEIPSGGKSGYFGPVIGARQAVVEEPGGYRFEWALPLSQLPYLKPEPGTYTGFTLFLTDHDAEGMAELMYLTDWGTPSGIEWRYWDCGLLYFAP